MEFNIKIKTIVVQLCALFLFSVSVLGQTNSSTYQRIDSLNKSVKELLMSFELRPQVGLNAKEILKVAKEENYKKGIADAYYNLAIYTERDSNSADASLRYMEKAILEYQNLEAEAPMLLQAIQNYADFLRAHSSNSPTIAVDYLKQQKKHFQHDSLLLGRLFFTIGQGLEAESSGYGTATRVDEKKIAEAISYYEKAIEIFSSINNHYWLTKSLENIALGYSKLGQIDKVEVIAEQVLALNISVEQKLQSLDVTTSYLQSQNNLSVIDLLQQMKTMLPKDSKGQVQFLDARISKQYLANALSNSLQPNFDQLHKAIALADAVVNYCDSTSAKITTTHKQSVYLAQEVLYQAYEQNNDYKNALINYKKYVDFDALFKKEEMRKERDVRIAEGKFKKSRDELQRKHLQFGQWVFGLLSALFFIGGIATFLYYRKRLTEQQLIQAENDKEQEANNARIEAQNMERLELGQNLHDSLGGLSNAQNFLSAVADDEYFLEKAKDILNKFHSELEGISRRMLPGVLVQLGLCGAIEDICEQNTQAGNAVFHFTSFGDFKHLDMKKQVNVYYMLNELINNIVKHAKAKEATIQLNLFENELNIMVEDDGVGFDVKEVLKNKSKDLQTVKSRVRYLNGTFIIDSQPGNGTSIIIDLPVQDERQQL